MVGGLEHVLFVHILGIILPTDFHIFQRGRYTTNQCLISCLRTWWFPGVQEAQESAGTATQLNGMWICRYSDRMFQDVVLMKLGCSCLMYDWGVGKGLKTPSKSYSWATWKLILKFQMFDRYSFTSFTYWINHSCYLYSWATKWNVVVWPFQLSLLKHMLIDKCVDVCLQKVFV